MGSNRAPITRWSSPEGQNEVVRDDDTHYGYGLSTCDVRVPIRTSPTGPAPEVPLQVRVGESSCSRLSSVGWGLYRALDLPGSGAWGWAVVAPVGCGGRAQDGVWGWGGVVWPCNEVVGMG